jgi:hypothetical protein
MAKIQSLVEDYLNDQIQTAADLDRIDALLEKVKGQQSQLQAQVGLVPSYKHDSVFLYLIARKSPPRSTQSGESC